MARVQIRNISKYDVFLDTGPSSAVTAYVRLVGVSFKKTMKKAEVNTWEVLYDLAAANKARIDRSQFIVLKPGSSITVAIDSSPLYGNLSPFGDQFMVHAELVATGWGWHTPGSTPEGDRFLSTRIVSSPVIVEVHCFFQ